MFQDYLNKKNLFISPVNMNVFWTKLRYIVKDFTVKFFNENIQMIFFTIQQHMIGKPMVLNQEIIIIFFLSSHCSKHFN